jgi:hypothetical protein
MDQPVKAEGLIWLIVGVFWVIAQIAGAAAKKNQPRPPLSDKGETGEAPADPFTELLRKMAGVEEVRVDPPVLRPEEPLKPTLTRTKNHWKPGEIERLPDIKPLRRVTDITPSPAPVLPKIDVRPKMSAFRNSIPSIKLPAMNLSFQGSATSIGNVPNLAKILNPADKNSLRKAMLSHIIFSPPKALEQPARQ